MLTNECTLIEAKYHGKYVIDDEKKWEDDIVGWNPPKIIDAKKEAGRLLRAELSILPKDKLVDLDKSRVLRKDFYQLEKQAHG